MSIRMLTYLDNQPFTSRQLPDSPTVAHLIESARGSLEGSGRMLVGVRCNGEELSPERLESLIHEPIIRFSRIELISDEPAVIVLGILQHARDLFGQTFELMKQSAGVLAAGNSAEALETLAACVHTWSQTHEAVVKGGALLGIQFMTLQIEGRSVDQWLSSMVSGLRSLRDTIESKDHVLLGDILKYELDETLQAWEAFLDGFITHVERACHAPTT
jgi:hypothetical protein